MFTVGLDVDSIESGIVVKLSLTTGLFAGNPRSSWSSHQRSDALKRGFFRRKRLRLFASWDTPSCGSQEQSKNKRPFLVSLNPLPAKPKEGVTTQFAAPPTQGTQCNRTRFPGLE